MNDPLELLRFVLALIGFLALVSLPAVIDRAVRARRARSAAGAASDEVGAQLDRLVEALKEQTERIEESIEGYNARQGERDERIAARQVDYDRTPGRVATPS